MLDKLMAFILGLEIYYVIKRETNHGTSFRDTINRHGWWGENEHSMKFKSKKEAYAFIEKDSKCKEWYLQHGNYTARLLSVGVERRIKQR